MGRCSPGGSGVTSASRGSEEGTDRGGRFGRRVLVAAAVLDVGFALLCLWAGTVNEMSPALVHIAVFQVVACLAPRPERAATCVSYGRSNGY